MTETERMFREFAELMSWSLDEGNTLLARGKHKTVKLIYIKDRDEIHPYRQCVVNLGPGLCICLKHDTCEEVIAWILRECGVVPLRVTEQKSTFSPNQSTYISPADPLTGSS